MEIVKLILCALVGYLLGNIQTGLIVGKLTGVDLRKHGSGSSGATNALRVLGRKSGLLTFIGDMLKGVLASVAGLLIAGPHGGMTAALFVIVGHIWPAFYNFHGGKGAATSIGALLVLFPLQTLILLAVGVVTILLTKMVSVGSIAGALAFLIAGIVTAVTKQDWFILAFSILLPALVIFAHRANIGRLLRGTENKLSSSMFKK